MSIRKRFSPLWTAAALYLGVAMLGVTGGMDRLPAAAPKDDFASVVQPVVQKYCLSCHSTKVKKGDLDLERFASIDHAAPGPETVAGDDRDARIGRDAAQEEAATHGGRTEGPSLVGSRFPRCRGAGAGWRSWPLRAAPPQQCRVQLHHSRPDGCRFASGPRLPGRRGRRRGVHQRRRGAVPVAGAAGQVPERGQGDRGPCRVAAGRVPLLAVENAARLD